MRERVHSAAARSPIRRGARWIGRAVLHLRFLAFGRDRHDRLVLEWVAGRPILVLPKVMNPVLFLSGESFAVALSPDWIEPGSSVLDMGTGSGVCAVFAARWADRVVAVDVNPEAVRCARINALLHRIEDRVDVREGDLFAPVEDERFDVVLFNPPYLPGHPRSEFERALRSTDTIERFAAALGGHLTTDGIALVLLSSIGDEAAHLESFRSHGFSAEPVVHRNLLVERLTVYRMRPA